MATDILNQLQQVLNARKNADPSTSYVAGLYDKGLETILKKIGEESIEVIMAAQTKNQNDIVNEMGDLWFHCLVLLSHKNINISEVTAVLEKRFGTSGLTEKAGRLKK